jgi:hypothetical protein
MRRLAAILAIAFATIASAGNFPLGTYIYTGSVLNYGKSGDGYSESFLKHEAKGGTK